MEPLVIGGLILLLLLASHLAARRIDRIAGSRTLASLGEIPENTRIVVLGCTPRLRTGHPNRYFTERAAAAAAAYHHDPRTRILCTGRVGGDGIDEAEALAELLVSARVPRSAIDIDAGSERTIDSIDFVASHDANRPILLVTQAFHMPRALYLARRRGLDAWGLVARGPEPGIRGRARERLARIRALLDLARTVPR